jgi:hypothetical protein
MSNNANNRLLQQALQAEGLYKGKIDGVIGPLTRKALELHDKAKNQPLPRERPGPPVPLSPEMTAGAPGGPSAVADMQLSMLPDTPPMSPPSMGRPDPASAEWIRSALGAVLGGRDRVPENPLVRMRSNLPDVTSAPPPAYKPNFAGDYGSPSAPMDPSLEPFMRKLEVVTSQPPMGMTGELPLGYTLARALRASQQ